MDALKRDMLERCALIFGEHSAAAKALRSADAHDGPVKFYSDNGVYVVAKLPKENIDTP